MAEQSILERLRSTHSPADHRGARMKLLFGALIGVVAAAILASFNGILWAIPGLLIAGGCAWAYFVRGAKH